MAKDTKPKRSGNKRRVNIGGTSQGAFAVSNMKKHKRPKTEAREPSKKKTD